ncbi:MAG TPA: HD domain-containing phosphohydrolase [Nitrosomonas sp.]|nr:HD domain-containing phosphohydrolase [Nitrosomonas sp.]
MPGSGTQIAADARADSLAALATSKFIHQKILVRLFWGWLLLCIVIGSAILWVEINRFQHFVHELALKESAALSNQLTSDLQQLDTLTGQSLTNLAQQLVGQRFLIVELYDLDKKLKIEAIRPGEEATERWIDRYRHQFPRQGEFSRQFHFTDGKLLLVMLVPVTGDGNMPVGYFEGIYQVDQQTVDSIKHELLRTLLFVTISITFTTLLMYPVILALNRGLIRLSGDLLRGNLELMNVLGCAIAERDSDTNSHNYRVTYYALRLGEAVGLPHEAIRNLIMGAFLHDVGKIGIRDSILLKPGKLTPQEFETMKKHVALSVDILNQSSWIGGARDVVESHHEKYDGSGYPRGLKGEAIPLNARIFTIADVFDALTSRRPYKTPWPVAEAIHFLEQESGQHFDPELVACFVAIAPAIYDELHGMAEEQMVPMLQRRIARHFMTAVTVSNK